jgi:ATP-dependent Clp protease ATP-binding subunit ClpB
MTSNIGSPLLLEGISASGQIEERVRDRVLSELRAHFRPEFLNRVDDIVLFKPLTLDEIERIVALLMRELSARLARQRICLTLTEAARELVAREGFDPVYGARPLKRYLQRRVDTALARKVLRGEIPEGSEVVMDVANGELDFRVEGGKECAGVGEGGPVYPLPDSEPHGNTASTTFPRPA